MFNGKFRPIFFSRLLLTEFNFISTGTKSDSNWKYIPTNFKQFSKWQCSHRVFSALKPEMSLSATRWCLCKTSISSSSSCLSFTAPLHFNPRAFKSSSKTLISLHSLLKSLLAYKQREFLNFFYIFWMEASRCAYKRNITLNSVRQHKYFITQGNYIGYVFRL